MLTEHEIHAIEHDLTDRVRVLLCADWRSLQAQLAEMTADRDSEQRWAKQYCDEMVKWQQTAEHLEKVMGGMKADYAALEQVNEQDKETMMALTSELANLKTQRTLMVSSSDPSQITCNLTYWTDKVAALTADLLASTNRMTAQSQELNSQHKTIQALTADLDKLKDEERDMLKVQLEQARRTILKLWQDYRPFVKGKLSEADIAAINAATPVPTRKE